MMILRSAVPSPFGRKVQIALSLLGMDDVKFEPADTMDPRDSVRAQNPLGKIPVLVLEDGTNFYDSRVILEYLDHRSGGGKIIPREPNQRFPLCGCRRCAMVFSMLQSSEFTRAVGVHRKNTNPNG